MTSAALGKSISPVEVTNISRSGFWVLLSDEERFLLFSELPWFRDVAALATNRSVRFCSK